MNNINIIFNSSNYDSARKLFSYKLPINQRFENKMVSLSYVSIYKQFENIKAEYGNNIVTIKWIDGVDYIITIPDGNYSITQLNELIQFTMLQNKLYCLDSSNNNNYVMFLELLTNPTQYAAQINLFTVPDSAEASDLKYTLPEGASWAFPVSKITPSITFNNAFGTLIGFTGNTYGNSITTLSLNSDLTPQIAVVNSLLIRTNLINNEYTNPNDIIGAMDLNGEYGTLLVKNMGQLLYSNITANNFSEIIVYFSDQHYNVLAIKDPEVSIQLSIVDKIK